MKEKIDSILLSEGRTLIVWLAAHSYIDEAKFQVSSNMPVFTSVLLYTSDHCYRISAKKTYLGCTVSTRRNRPGETWNRGNDLPDGPFAKDVFDKIMGAIVGYELKKIALPVERVGEEKEETVGSPITVVNNVVTSL